MTWVCRLQSGMEHLVHAMSPGARFRFQEEGGGYDCTMTVLAVAGPAAELQTSAVPNETMSLPLNVDTLILPGVRAKLFHEPGGVAKLRFEASKTIRMTCLDTEEAVAERPAHG